MKVRPDLRLDRNLRSVSALAELLKTVISQPANFVDDGALIHALRSQGAMAKLGDASRGIYPSSINTIKRISDASLEGGFHLLDKLRLGALDAIANERGRSAKPGRETKTALALRVAELEGNVQLLKEELFLLTMALDLALSQGANYASKAGKGSVLELCKREQRELLDMLSLRRVPRPSNVKEFPKK